MFVAPVKSLAKRVTFTAHIHLIPYFYRKNTELNKVYSEQLLYFLYTLQYASFVLLQLSYKSSIGAYAGAPLLEQGPCGGERVVMVLDQIGKYDCRRARDAGVAMDEHSAFTGLSDELIGGREAVGNILVLVIVDLEFQVFKILWE